MVPQIYPVRCLLWDGELCSSPSSMRVCPPCPSHAGGTQVIDMVAHTGISIVYGRLCAVIPCWLWDREHCSSPSSVCACVCLSYLHRRRAHGPCERLKMTVSTKNGLHVQCAKVGWPIAATVQ